jgi:hypothetical protein
MAGALPSDSGASSISSHFKNIDLMMISLAACMPSAVLALSSVYRKLISANCGANFSHREQEICGIVWVARPDKSRWGLCGRSTSGAIPAGFRRSLLCVP